MRSTPGATSVTSSDAGSCSCRGGRVALRLRVGHARQGIQPPEHRRDRTGVSCEPLPTAQPRARRSVRRFGASSTGVRHGGELGPGAVRLRRSRRTRGRALPRDGGRRPAARPACRRRSIPAGMLTAGMPEMLNGAVNGTEPMPPTRWPADLERRRPFGHERGRGGGRREDQVDLVEDVGDRAQHLPAPLQRTQRAGRR